MKVIRILSLIILLGVVPLVEVAQKGYSESPGVKPAAGFVPDAGTAIKIAEAVLLPIYGEKQISEERPLSASLRGDVWIVVGNLPPGMDGGSAEVLISKKDGRILKVTHSS